VSARTLADWLEFIGRQHPDAIALGLERVRAVMVRMDIAFQCPVITVGGTNGKGSVCAYLEGILRASGRRVGLYASPHLLRYNERVRLDGREASDERLCASFAAVERARGDVPLTYFEFGTLGAFWLFSQERPDALVLEVGLGGRLDAVNVLDADCAVLTSVALDHTELLGDTREAIGREKAAIFRAARPAVVADPEPPSSVLQEAQRIGARGGAAHHALARGEPAWPARRERYRSREPARGRGGGATVHAARVAGERVRGGAGRGARG
jgi:dihydrofolate synthase / folylpolyglutamate synthase